MSAFTEFTQFELVDGVTYRITAPVVWDIGVYGSPWKLKLEEGFEFDLSVPKGFHWLLSPHDKLLLPAAAVHDKLLLDGHDAAFASSEFRRAAVARGASKAMGRFLAIATYLYTVWYDGSR